MRSAKAFDSLTIEHVPKPQRKVVSGGAEWQGASTRRCFVAYTGKFGRENGEKKAAEVRADRKPDLLLPCTPAHAQLPPAPQVLGQLIKTVSKASVSLRALLDVSAPPKMSSFVMKEPASTNVSGPCVYEFS